MIRVLVKCDNCQKEIDFNACSVPTTEKRAEAAGWKMGGGDADFCPRCKPAKVKTRVSSPYGHGNHTVPVRFAGDSIDSIAPAGEETEP